MYKIGMILKNKKKNPTFTFAIADVYYRTYKNGEIAERVVGLHLGDNAARYVEEEDKRKHIPHPSDWDARSIERMYPYVMWQPIEDLDESQK